MIPPRLLSVDINGFKPFRDFSAAFGPLEVFVGANGSGKSSLFEFLRFIRDGAREPIPPEIVKGTIGQEIFHKPGKDEFEWNISADLGQKAPLYYKGILQGPKGNILLPLEEAGISDSTPQASKVLMQFNNESGLFYTRRPDLQIEKWGDKRRKSHLMISVALYEQHGVLRELSEYLQSWRFFSSFNIDRSQMRRSIPSEQNAVLQEDAGNISSVLHNLFTDQDPAFNEIQNYLKSVVPGFHGLKVKPRGGPGEVIAFWEEEGVDMPFTLANLSDGILHLLIWITLCVHPNPPPLICIDEPELGVHPRALPLLAGLFSKAAERTQVFIATHSSYFLSQFRPEEVTVMKKEDGRVIARKVSDSKALMASLDDFGSEELETMHKNDELESLS